MVRPRRREPLQLLRWPGEGLELLLSRRKAQSANVHADSFRIRGPERLLLLLGDVWGLRVADGAGGARRGSPLFGSDVGSSSPPTPPRVTATPAYFQTE